ncbi:hypothetical protein EK0264_04760 [Epidermidibacterium keratini]|uniref:Knr4/Smi1-like domain-containing protein n=1 Tax=Epidermidibacterium keratini TaxID=1891644 RepID=A0A7L4YLA9_9ACTN|nr:SMI1/KNR4 family protein [Epidermidibacterium keratini]QHB99662.1 hypothetical protein EK0264_04760 [Epidermidibacterium keratini]
MDVGRSWEVIERVLREHAPVVADTLRGPASDADLDRLVEAVGRPLPADFVESLRIHDGQDNPTQLVDLYNHQTLLSVEAMIESSELRRDVLGDDPSDTIGWMIPDKVRPVSNLRAWVQFTASDATGFALDLDPLPAGEVGQVIWLPIDGPTPAPEFASYAAWLSHLAQKLDAGAFQIDDLGLWLEND